jgi:hypothetical protein
MADIAPDEGIPPSLAAVGADSEVSSVGSSQEDSNSTQPVDNNAIAAASTTAAEASSAEDSNSAQPVENDGTAAASIAAAESTESSPNINGSGNTSTSTSTNSTPKQPAAIKSRTSFTADSPYFTSFCDGEIKSLSTLSNSLRDISARTNTFCRTGALMSEAMHRLANSCKLCPERNLSQDHPDEERHEKEDVVQQRRQAVGEEMAKLLQLLGEVSQSACLFVR